MWNIIHSNPFWTFMEKEGWYKVVSSRSQGGAGALVVDSLGQVILLKVLRRALGGVMLEIPRGAIDPGEEAYAAGLREGQEETGLDFEGAQIHPLGLFYPDSGIMGTSLHLSLVKLPHPFPDDIPVDFAEVEGYEIWAWSDVLEAVLSGEIGDASTVIAVLRTQALMSMDAIEL